MSKRPAWPGLRRASGESDDQLIEKVRSGDSEWLRRALSPPPCRCGIHCSMDVALTRRRRRCRGGCLRRGLGGDPQRQRPTGQLPQLSARRRSQRLPVAWPSVGPAAQRPTRSTPVTPMFEDPERYVEADTVARAFASLNPRWQQTLWLTEVEQRSPAEVAAHMDLAPNATAALTLRAREAFATAYLAEHVSGSPDEVCERYGPRLAAYVRDQLTDLQRDEIDRHLVECPRCQMAVNELSDVNASLRKLLPPALPALTAPWTVGPPSARCRICSAPGCCSRVQPRCSSRPRCSSTSSAAVVAARRTTRTSGWSSPHPTSRNQSSSRSWPLARCPPRSCHGRASAGTTTTTIAPAEGCCETGG